MKNYSLITSRQVKFPAFQTLGNGPRVLSLRMSNILS